MKDSSATSGAASAGPSLATPTGAPRSASSPTHTAEFPPGGFPLAGPSRRPDPATHAYRADLADIALAGTVIASHYAVPLVRQVKRPAVLRAEPREDSDALVEIAAGDEIRMLDKRGGWAWGYAGGRVGYLPASAL